MITYKIHLVRTGSTAEGEWQQYVGQRDLPVSAQGEQWLYELQNRLAYPTVEMVFTSPLQRCVRTAGILYPETYTVPVEDLQDMGLGDFEGRGYDELKDDPAYQAWLQNSLENPPPNGERAEDFTRRIVGALQDIFGRMMEERMGNVAVVTHGGVIMSLLAGVGLPKLPIHEWRTENGCGYTLLVTPQMWMRDRAVEVYSRLPVPRE